MILKKICDSYFCTHTEDKKITYAVEYEIYEILDQQDETGKNMRLWQQKPRGCKIIEEKG